MQCNALRPKCATVHSYTVQLYRHCNVIVPNKCRVGFALYTVISHNHKRIPTAAGVYEILCPANPCPHCARVMAQCRLRCSACKAMPVPLAQPGSSTYCYNVNEGRCRAMCYAFRVAGCMSKCIAFYRNAALIPAQAQAPLCSAALYRRTASAVTPTPVPVAPGQSGR
jgi:hypothetical protein